MGHNHLHKRRHHQHRQNDDDPFGKLESGINSLANAAATFFNGGAPSPTAADGPSTIYITAAWTGTGTDFSLSTVVPAPTTEPSPPPTTKSPVQQTTTLHKTTHRTTSSSDAAAVTAAATTTAAAAALSSISSVLSISSSNTDASAAAATSGSAALSTQDASSGLSGGAKAGIAIGVILGVLALVAGAFALWRMKKNRDEEEYERNSSSEKNPFSDNAAVQAPPPPIMASMTSAPKPAYTPATAAPANPFGSGSVPVFPAGASRSGTMTSSTGNAATAAGAGMAAGAVVGVAAANARRASIPAPLNLNRAQSPALIPPPPMMPSPSGSNFSESSTLTTGAMAAVGGAGAGGPGGPRMHRVQMDFNPTMEDELRIAAGEIVRIVREFDDGWCSVEIIQRDGKGNVLRNQQGVVPRTCLSRLPLKPRQKRPGPPMSAAPQAVGSPNLNGSAGRSQSPALIASPVQRSMSPGPYGGGPQDRPQRAETRSRSNSANDVGIRSKSGPIGPSPMNPAFQAPSGGDLFIPGGQSPDILPAPLIPGHGRNGSVGSTASAVARKPVPRKE